MLRHGNGNETQWRCPMLCKMTLGAIDSADPLTTCNLKLLPSFLSISLSKLPLSFYSFSSSSSLCYQEVLQWVQQHMSIYGSFVSCSSICFVNRKKISVWQKSQFNLLLVAHHCIILLLTKHILGCSYMYTPLGWSLWMLCSTPEWKRTRVFISSMSPFSSAPDTVMLHSSVMHTQHQVSRDD